VYTIRLLLKLYEIVYCGACYTQVCMCFPYKVYTQVLTLVDAG